MKPLVRSNPKPSASRTRFLVVGPGGVKSVRGADEADPAMRLAIGVVVVVGVLVAVWLMGYLGFRLGFAPLIDVPHLRIDLGAGLVTGTIMLVSIPRVIILAGVAEPTWLMLGFLLIAIPAAGLGAVKPRTAGDPRPSSMALVFSYGGAVAAAVNTLIVVAWVASTARNSRVDQLRVDPQEAEAWITDLMTVAGLDVLAVIACALWVVLVMRLGIPAWLRAMAATASFFALVVATVAMSKSNVAVAQLEQARSEVFLDDGSVDTRLVLGSTGDHVATLRVDQGVAIVELHERAGVMTVIGRQSIVSMLEQAAQREARSRTP